MTPEKWQKIVDNAKDKFNISNEDSIHLEEEGGIDIKFIEFEGPLGRMRLEYIVKPVILDKKTIYTRRIGSETKVDYIYSENEKSHQLIVYKWNDREEDWEEIEGTNFL